MYSVESKISEIPKVNEKTMETVCLVYNFSTRGNSSPLPRFFDMNRMIEAEIG